MQTNPVGWFEIYVQDMTRARKFYEFVLDVELDKLETPAAFDLEMLAFPMGKGRPGAAGALVKMQGFAPGGNSTLVYFTCVDCGIEAGRVVSCGGRIHREKAGIGEHGFIALGYDTEGNMFGLHSLQ